MAEKVAHQIWQNECGHTTWGLTSWNQGEAFASCGIGHFIWYPDGKKGPFHEQFPEFLLFAKKRGAPIPSWLQKATYCPWTSREDFCSQMQSQKMLELRTFLQATVTLQAHFIAQKLETVLPKLVAHLSPKEKEHVAAMFHWICENENGLYPLIDYLNFKGEGIAPQERYEGQGWGLLQVLQKMKYQTQISAIEEFVSAAKSILTERVRHAPKKRGEERWLKGWHNRLDTYLKI